MKKKLLAFGASNSRQSINQQFARYAANQLTDFQVTILDLNDFEMPIYSIDREREQGIPLLARQFKSHIETSDGILISFAEHNGAYTVAFKNILDWVSRIKGPIWSNKPMLLLSTSPGRRGGRSVLEIAYHSFKHHNQSEINSFSLPSFRDNFSAESGITDEELHKALVAKLAAFRHALDGKRTDINT